MGWRRPAGIVALGVAFTLALGAADPVHSASESAGGTLRVVLPSGTIAPLDPALTPLITLTHSWGALWYPTCATLTAFRDAPGSAGYTIRSEAAAGSPEVSHKGRRYVYTVRRGLQFNDGSRVTGANFAWALHRVLDPAMHSEGLALFSDVENVSAHGRRLTIDLTHAAADLPMRLALPYACPVPLDFPPDPAGVPLTVGSGPYYISSATAQRIQLDRNLAYHGSRPHLIDQADLTIGGNAASNIRAVLDGRADIYGGALSFEQQQNLARYKTQLFQIKGSVVYYLAMNTSRHLFHNNPALRKAVNLALDRTAIAGVVGSSFAHSKLRTDQIIPRYVPGWVDHEIYPLARPNLRRAQALARGNLRGKKAVLYVDQNPPFMAEQANLIAQQLLQIGLHVTVMPAFAPEVLRQKAGTPGEPYDMVLTKYFVEYPDPANVLIRLLGGENARKPFGNTNYAYFESLKYDRRMAAANRLTGRARLREFSNLDAEIMRNAAPWAPLYEGSQWLFVSTRVSCLKVHRVFRLDVAGICVH